MYGIIVVRTPLARVFAGQITRAHCERRTENYRRRVPYRSLKREALLRATPPEKGSAVCVWCDSFRTQPSRRLNTTYMAVYTVHTHIYIYILGPWLRFDVDLLPRVFFFFFCLSSPLIVGDILQSARMLPLLSAAFHNFLLFFVFPRQPVTPTLCWVYCHSTKLITKSVTDYTRRRATVSNTALLTKDIIIYNNILRY